jgi:hypothetical protein
VINSRISQPASRYHPVDTASALISREPTAQSHYRKTMVYNIETEPSQQLSFVGFAKAVKNSSLVSSAVFKDNSAGSQ